MFSESQVQSEHGGGDYLLRSLINGHWGRSKAFSVAPLPGTTLPIVAPPDKNLASDMDRLKIELETQRVRLEKAQLGSRSGAEGTGTEKP